MSASELQELHLADLHARAAEAGIDGYRLLRREELIERLEGGESEAPSEGGAVPLAPIDRSREVSGRRQTSTAIVTTTHARCTRQIR